MLHFAVELRARTMACGLRYDQLADVQHGYVYDERDYWKITCPNCRAFAFPERKKRRLTVARSLCGRANEGYPSPIKWCPLSCAMPPQLVFEPFSPMTVLATIAHSRQLVTEARELSWQLGALRRSERVARSPARGLDVDLALERERHTRAERRRVG